MAGTHSNKREPGKLQKGEPRTFWFDKDGAEGVFLSVTEEEGRGG